jgi:hypothetical protein
MNLPMLEASQTDFDDFQIGFEPQHEALHQPHRRFYKNTDSYIALSSVINLPSETGDLARPYFYA